MLTYLQRAQVPRSWTMKAPLSYKKKMAKPLTKKVKTLNLDDVDVHWNNGLCDFEANHVDGAKSSGYDESNLRDDIATTHNEVQVVVAITLPKPSVSKFNLALAFFSNAMPNVASCIFFSVVQSQRPHELIAMSNPLLNVGLQGGQVFGLINNVLHGNLMNLCVGLQGGLGGFPTLKMMGQWNPLQQIQTIQALQTPTSLGIGQVGQQLGLS